MGWGLTSGVQGYGFDFHEEVVGAEGWEGGVD